MTIGAIYLPRRWKRQPHGLQDVRADLGVDAFYAPIGQGFIDYAARSLHQSAGASLKIESPGQVVAVAGSSGVNTGRLSFARTRLFADATSRFTVLTLARLQTTNSSSQGTFFARAGSTVANRTLQVYRDQTALGVYARGALSSATIANATDFLPAAISWDGTTMRVFAGRTLNSVVSVGSAAEETSEPYTLGARTGGTGYVVTGSIAYNIVFARALSNDEYLNAIDNPWQYLKPRKALRVFDMGAGGGGINLVIADASHGHTADSPTLSTDWLLTVADSNHAHAADNLTLGVAGVADLVIAEAAHSHSAESPTLSTEWLLSIADALHGHAADNLTLSTGSVVDLTIADGLHSHTAEAVVLSSDSYLVVADSTHGHVADSPAFSLDTYLVIADGGHAHYADVLTLNTSSFSQDDLDFLLAYIQENLVVPTAAEIAAAVLAAAALDPIAANVKEVNDVAIAGTGVPPTYDVTMPAVIDPGDPWRPA